MREKLLLLERGIEEDLATIERIFADIEAARLEPDTPEKDRVFIGYRLHNLYNAFENIFRNIAATFENDIDDPLRWHADLLRRMRLDLAPVRPALIDAALHDRLDELRRFRHVFRSVYGAELDPLRMGLALQKAKELGPLYPGQLSAFLRFVRSLRETG